MTFTIDTAHSIFSDTQIADAVPLVNRKKPANVLHSR